MKLIANKATGSLLRFFPEIENGERWSPKWSCTNPAVVSVDGITIPAWANVSSEPKWFAFKVLGGVDNVISFDYHGSSPSCAVHLSVYDYLGYGEGDDTAVASGAVGVVSNVSHALTVRIGSTRVLLAKAVPYVEDWHGGIWYSHYVPGTNVRLDFSRAVEPFSSDAHLVRDWRDGIDGTWWSATGKVYRWKSLDDIGRRRNA